jgi:hypothetical protein
MADILAILLTPGAEGERRLQRLRMRTQGARLVLLTTPAAASRLAGFADEVWGEGVARGPGRFLALVRRISWMSFAEVHDLEASPLTRLMRFCVWPRPKWHLHKHRTGL